MTKNPYSLSPQEVQVLEAMDLQKPIIFAVGASENTKFLVEQSFLLNKLGEGKCVVIRSSDKRQTLKRIEEVGLAELVLDLSEDTIISKNSLCQPIGSDRRLFLDAIKTKLRYENLLERLKEMQKTYTEPIFGEFSRKKLAELLFLSKKRGERPDLDLYLSQKNYSFNHEEYWHLRNKVERASKHFRSSYEFLKTSDKFCNNVYRDFHLAENQAVVFKYLNKFINEAEALRTRFKSIFLRISETLYSGYRKRISDVDELVEDFALHLSYYKIELDLIPRSNTFSRNKNPQSELKQDLRSRYELLKSTVEATQIFKIQAPENSWEPDTGALDEYIQNVKKLLKNAHLTIKIKVEEQIEILNSNNYDEDELRILSSKFSDLIYAINGAKLFKKELHNLTISAWKNFQFLSKCIEELVASKVFLEANINYAIYRSFEYSLDRKTGDLIASLYKVKPSMWVECYEGWYFKALFEKYYLHDLVNAQSRYDELEQVKHLNNELNVFRISQIFEQKRFGNKRFEKKIQKDGINWKSALILDSDSFKSHFPIVVCDTHFFPSEIDNLKYDFLICDENDDIPTTLFSNSHFSGILCLNRSTPNQAIIKKAKEATNYETKKKLTLKSSVLQVQGLHEAKNKLALGKYLSFILSAVTLEVKFYSGRDFSIITCLPDFCTKLIEIELYDNKIKPLKYTHLQSGIVDDIMIKEDRSKYLIIQDGFLDPSLDIEWQISTLRSLRMAGIKVISINGFVLASQHNLSILDMLEIQEMRSQRGPKTELHEP